MGISVTCPNGHEFKVKDKYAGKKGLCPYCKGQVAVRVPDASTSADLKKEALRAASMERGEDGKDSSVFDEPDALGSGDSASLLGASVIRYQMKCKCGEAVPMWFARCPKCGEYMPRKSEA